MSRAAPFLLIVLAAALSPRAAFAQASWEYTPYQARLWIVPAGALYTPPAASDRLGSAVQQRATAVMGAVMALQLAVAPPSATAAIRRSIAHLTAEAIASAATTEDLEADKIYLARITSDSCSFQISVRELDCRTRQLGPVVERSCTTASTLPLAVWDAILESFTPLARIEQAQEGRVVARLRAGSLATDEASPALVEPGMVLRPILRRNDRSGQPVKNGILPVGWTYFSVTERHGAVIECEQRSGYRLAIPARGGIRLERLALLIRPYHDQTRLLLRSRTQPDKPLIGYEIHRRIENTDQTELVGATDAQGAITLPAADGNLETFIVKSGRQLLARLPIVPGYESTLTAHVADDDGRLAAEGVIQALSSRALDLVARREVLAARIRSRLKDKKPEEAQPLLEEFRRLASRADLSRELDRYRQQITSRDKTTQARIDRIFTDGQRLLLLRPLSDDLLAQLTREVAAAKTESE
jgi:hypothetical protein